MTHTASHSEQVMMPVNAEILEDGTRYVYGIVNDATALKQFIVSLHHSSTTRKVALIPSNRLHQLGHDLFEHGERDQSPHEHTLQTFGQNGVDVEEIRHRITALCVVREDVPEANWAMLPSHPSWDPFGGARGAVAYLLASQQETLSVGETIPILTSHGAIDLSKSAQSTQLDMGRWRLLERIDDKRSVIKLGRTYEVQIIDREAAKNETNSQKFHDQASPSKVQSADGTMTRIIAEYSRERIRDGVGIFQYRIVGDAAIDVPVSNATAAVAALALRDYQFRTQKNVMNFWRAEHDQQTLAVRMYPTEEGEHVAVAGSVI